MSIKKSLLAGALALCAVAAMPAVAGAVPHLDYTGTFTSHGGASQLRSGGLTIECTSVTNHGEFETHTTGWVKFTFHGCIEKVFGTHCQTAGQPTGTITTTELPFHLQTVTKPSEENKVTPAILITPNAVTKQFAHFSCPTVGATITVEGNGIIGKIQAPNYNELSSEGTINFAESGGVQEYRTLHGDETETEYTLQSSVNGEAPKHAVEIAEGTLTFPEAVRLTE